MNLHDIHPPTEPILVYLADKFFSTTKDWKRINGVITYTNMSNSYQQTMPAYDERYWQSELDYQNRLQAGENNEP